MQESYVLEPSEDGAKGSDSRHGLKVELAGHADGLEWHLELHEITAIKALPFLSAQRLPIARSKCAQDPQAQRGSSVWGTWTLTEEAGKCQTGWSKHSLLHWGNRFSEHMWLCFLP